MKGIPVTASQIVLYIEGVNMLYKGEYCDSGKTCPDSTRGTLNTNTAELTIESLDFDDNDYYYYEAQSDKADTGKNFEYYLQVYGTFQFSFYSYLE